MNDLVQRLSEGRHPIEVSLRPERTVRAFRECLDRGYVQVRFTQTRGGTQLGMPIDAERTNLRDADFERETGSVTLVGELTLDYVRVRCVADVSLPLLEGVGHLERLNDGDAASQSS